MCIRMMSPLLVFVYILSGLVSSGTSLDSSLTSTNPGWNLLLGNGVGNQHSKVHTSSHYPGSRADAASWVDANGQLWMFGGHGYDENPTDQPESLGDLWRLDMSALKWTLVQNGKGSGETSPSFLFRPQARSGSALCGVTDNLLVLFGGISNKQKALFDTWIFDIPQLTWLPLFARYANKTIKPRHPKPRHNTAHWCTKSHLIVYGGKGGKEKDLDDLWTFSFLDLAWEKKQQFVQMDKIAVGAPSQPFPLARSDATTWMDDHMIYLYGGSLHNGTALGDIWKFDMNTSMWSWIVNDKSRSSRVQALVWKDSAPNNVIIFGGCLDGNHSIVPEDDIAMFNFKDKAWKEIELNSSYTFSSQNDITSSFINKPSNPSARCRSVTWNYKGQHFLFGGFGLDQMKHLTYLNDLYVLVDSQTSLDSLFKPRQKVLMAKGSLQLSARRIFLICFASFGGVVLVFGAVFFFKKMVDFPRHHPSRSYNIKYSPLNDEASMFDT